MIRLAGRALKSLGSKIGSNFGSSLGKMSKLELAANLAPDIVIGGIYGMQTPGGMTDKIITGMGSAVGGAAGGVGIRGALGVKNPFIGLGIDYAGSVGGDMLGVAAADSVVRARNGGATPMEKEMMMQQQQLEQRIRREAQEDLLRSLAMRQRYS